MQKLKYIILYLALSATAVSAQDLLQPDAWDGYYDIACREKLVDFYSDAFYMCRPSFTPEYALSIVNGRYSAPSRLVLKRATENLWYNDNYPRENGKRPKRDKWDKRHKYHDVKIETYRLDVRTDACLLIYNLVKAANETATYFNGEDSGCDGVTYYFHSWGRFGGTWSPNKYGRTWSPNMKCRTGRLVAVMDSICRAVELGDTAMLSRQLPSCRTLLGEFRNEYPMIAFVPKIYSYKEVYYNDEYFGVKYVDATDDTTSVNQVYLRTDFLQIKRVFPQPINMQIATEWARTMTERATLMTRKLFLQQDESELRFIVIIDERQQEEYYNTEKRNYHYLRLSDTVDFENRCFSASLDKVGFFRRGPDGSWQQSDTTGATQWWKEF